MKYIYSFLFLFSMVSVVMMAAYDYSDSSSESSDMSSEECEIEPETLKSIILVQRHSAIGTPVVLPKVPLDSACNYAPNKVSPAGVKQTKKIVDVIKTRYGSFLPTNSSEAFFRSTNLDRTLTSIALKIKCLLPTKKGDSPPLFFHPPRILDGLYPGSYCPAADQEVNYTNLLTPDAATFNKTNAKLINYLAKKTGLPADINIIEELHDYISSLKYNGCELPTFYSEKLWIELKTQLAALYNLYYASDLAQTLRGGPLATELLKRIDYFHQASKQEPCDQPQIPMRKLHVYETHSETIAAFLALIGLPLTSPVETGATLMIELHSISGEYYLRFYNLNDTESTPLGPIQTLTLAGSTKQGIKLDTFKALVAPHIPTDFDKQCDIPCTFDYHQALEDYLSETDDSEGPYEKVPE